MYALVHWRFMRRSERHVPGRAILTGVDRLAGEHRITRACHVLFVEKLDQRRACRVVDTLLGVIQRQTAGLDAVALSAGGIGGEQLGQMPLAGCLGQLAQPGPASGQ